jgi:hypothetical protein
MLSRGALMGTLGLAVSVLVGCSTHSDAPRDGGSDADAAPICGVGFIGDPGRPMDIEVTARNVDGTSSVLSDGASVALIFPPQGGRVIFVGVRALNVDPCAVQLSGALRDLQNAEVRVDVRTVNLAQAMDGRGVSTDSDISTFSNVPVCPNQWSASNAYGTPYDLVVSVTDRGGRTASKTVRVTLACAEPDRALECLCICKAGYVLGQTCEDSGVPDAGDGSSEAEAAVDAPVDGVGDSASDGVGE